MPLLWTNSSLVLLVVFLVVCLMYGMSVGSLGSLGYLSNESGLFVILCW